MEFFKKPTQFPFMATRKVWYGLSIVLMLASFASFATRGLNLGIDFTGGVSVEAGAPAAPATPRRPSPPPAPYPPPNELAQLWTTSAPIMDEQP